MSEASGESFIDPVRIASALQAGHAGDPTRVREILAKARRLKGLSLEDVACLASVRDPELLHELYATAREVKEAIYGPRLVIFAPLYVSNLCGNDCAYCAFRASNRELRRRTLGQDEIAAEVERLVDAGHKRVLLVAGEAYPPGEGFRYVTEAMATIYRVRRGKSGEIRRVNVNVAPLEVDQFRELKAAGIGTYQLFQETYHPETYAQVHLRGKKRDYAYRLGVMDRAMTAGIDDVGVGVLFGLYDWRFELLALMQHAEHLESCFGVGPHTISVPRLEPAQNAELATHSPWAVDDDDFRKIVAILRLAVPYTGLILSTRERPEVRREALALGISQISAGSRTDPGGYADGEGAEASQFQLGDHRSLDEVVRDVASLGYVPSFCTGCYRMGRTGQDFMDMARPGEIKLHCNPNGLSTYLEYLLDYATPETAELGERLIARTLDGMAPAPRQRSERLLEAVRRGKRDVFV